RGGAAAPGVLAAQRPPHPEGRWGGAEARAASRPAATRARRILPHRAARRHPPRHADRRQEARRPHIRSLRAAVRNLRLSGWHRRFSAREPHQATFFMGGKWMLSHRERTQQLMSDPLFEVANHTWEHRNLRVVSGQALVDEIKNAQVAYEQVREELEAKRCTGPPGTTLAHEQAPRRLSLLRFPYGLAARRRWTKPRTRACYRSSGTFHPAIRPSPSRRKRSSARCSPTSSRARSFYSTPMAADGTPMARSPASSPRSRRAATNSPRFRSCWRRVSRWCRPRVTTRDPATPTGPASAARPHQSVRLRLAVAGCRVACRDAGPHQVTAASLWSQPSAQIPPNDPPNEGASCARAACAGARGNRGSRRISFRISGLLPPSPRYPAPFAPPGPHP